MELLFRRATASDAALLSEMGFRTYRHHFAHLWNSENELSAFLEAEYSVAALQQSLNTPGVRWLIAEAAQPTGFAKLSWRRPVPERNQTGALLHKLYLMPGETGKGYGEAFWQAILREARAENETWLWLEVLEANAGARRFYDARGLKMLTQTLFSSATQQSVLFIMGKALDDNA